MWMAMESWVVGLRSWQWGGAGLLLVMLRGAGHGLGGWLALNACFEMVDCLVSRHIGSICKLIGQRSVYKASVHLVYTTANVCCRPLLVLCCHQRVAASFGPVAVDAAVLS